LSFIYFVAILLPPSAAQLYQNTKTIFVSKFLSHRKDWSISSGCFGAKKGFLSQIFVQRKDWPNLIQQRFTQPGSKIELNSNSISKRPIKKEET
jgi:hypothetical protein